MAAKQRLLVQAPPRRRLLASQLTGFARAEELSAFRDDTADAARWRALLSSARVSVYQSKGFPMAGTSPHSAEMFLSVEFHHAVGAMPITQPGRMLVTAYADAIIAREKQT